MAASTGLTNAITLDTTQHMKPYDDPKLLEKLYYDEVMSLHEIADELGCSSATVMRYMEKFGLERRKRGDWSDYHTRKGQPVAPSLMVAQRGYEVFVSHSDGKQHRLLHHRLLAAVEHDLDEFDGKEVHHKNGITWDNRLDNLQLVTPQEHANLHR